jgi:hypothetical protein
MPIHLNKRIKLYLRKFQASRAETCWPEAKRAVANRNTPFMITEDIGKTEWVYYVMREESLQQEDYKMEVGGDKTLETIIINLEESNRALEKQRQLLRRTISSSSGLEWNIDTTISLVNLLHAYYVSIRRQALILMSLSIIFR